MSDLESKRYAEQGQVLKLLSEIQKDSSPIIISIGWVDNDKRIHPEIIIKSAPLYVVQKLIEEGYCLDITLQGVKVYKI